MKKYTKQERELIVQEYVAAGFSLIPLTGKRPISRNWQNTDYKQDLTLEKLGGGNFGVVLKSDDLVIDVDPRNFKGNSNSLKKFMNYLGRKYFDTFVVLTGGGGLHIYMKKPVEMEINGNAKKFPGIEFKSQGQQVVGATSIHPETGRTYDLILNRLSIEIVEKVFEQ